MSLQNKTIGLETVKALKENRFEAAYFETAQDALEHLLTMIPPAATVGIGGSRTLEQLGVMQELERRGNTVYNHNLPGQTPDEKQIIRRKQLTCDLFLTGTNAVTRDGRLVNTDGVGNRVAAMIFGPKKVIVVAGTNKIVPDIVKAEERIKKIAAPLNNKRIKRNNPCVKAGSCADCKGPGRICNATTILHCRPTFSEIHVLLVGEELGF